MWDDEVAVLTVGAGPGGLAYAVATADAGLDVLVTSAPGAGAQAPDETRGWLPTSADALTEEYLSELVAGLEPIMMPPDAGELPARTLYRPPAPGKRRVIPTFVGARLPGWAGHCLASPYGAVLTAVDHWPTTLRARNGAAVEIASIGVADDGTLSDWMTAALRDREISVLRDATLARLVFEENRVAGAVFDTPDGDYAVQTHHGVAFTPRFDPPVRLVAGAEVALVGLAGSRFVQLQMVHISDPAPGS